ncbi:MAG: IclR family transcriptional regulator [Beutenbergiaceae bacterium]
MRRNLENQGSRIDEPIDDPRVVQSVARAVRVMKHMAQSGKPLGLGVLARTANLSKPATYHLLRTLVIEGLVSKRPDSTYELSWGIWELGASVTRRLDLVQIARHHLDTLAEESEEVVLLSILDRHSVIYLDRGEVRSAIPIVADSGRRSSLHANASGKLLLAFSEPNFIEEVLSEELQSFTSATVTDPKELLGQLAAIRERELAWCWQEQEIGVSSIAAPIRQFGGKVVAALALAGPAARMNRATMPRLSGKLTATAQLISRELGASPQFF